MSLVDLIIKIALLGRGAVSLVFAISFCLYLSQLDMAGRRTFHDVMVTTFLYPAQVTLDALNRGVLVFTEHDALKSENARLRLESDALRARIGLGSKDTLINENLIATPFSMLKANVVAEQPSRLVSTWIIDKGRRDSVSDNMPVITSQGVVGKVIRVYGRHSLVQLHSDPNFRMSIMVLRTRSRGLLEYWKVGRMAARFPAGSDVMQGDTLVSSGMGGVFPKGIRAGVVSSPVRNDPDQGDILIFAEVFPFQDPNRVEEAFIVLNRPSFIVGDTL